ncbi:MAG: glycosyltransferase family 2 protein, partial [Candidatus Hodarchaeota archaeon]
FVIKRAAFEQIGGFDTSIDFYGEDTDVARRLNKVGHVKFTFTLPIYASGRRLAKEGIIKTGIRYSANYFWVSFSGKPLTKTSTDIRIKKT